MEHHTVMADHVILMVESEQHCAAGELVHWVVLQECDKE